MATNYSPRIVTDGLVLYLDAANPKSYSGSGTTWKDISGNGNDGTLLNGVGYSSDNKGEMIFDYSDDYLTIDHSDIFNFSNQLTVLVFAFPEYQNTTFRTIITKGYRTGLTPSCFMIRHGRSVSNNNQIFGQIRTTDGSFTAGHIPSSNFDNNWHHYALSFSGSESKGRLYIDSVLVDTVSTTGTLTNNTRDITIGRVDISDTTEYWDGKISNIQIYNRALTADEISQNFQATRSRYGI